MSQRPSIDGPRNTARRSSLRRDSVFQMTCAIIPYRSTESKNEVGKFGPLQQGHFDRGVHQIPPHNLRAGRSGKTAHVIIVARPFGDKTVHIEGTIRTGCVGV